MVNAVGNIARPGCSAEDGAGTDAGKGAGAKGDADGPEGIEGKIDITMPDKTNKIPILVSY